MPIVATAGHVDHGKSTLVDALTGRDPDRWAEEKRRGLTIDLGFAWTDIGRPSRRVRRRARSRALHQEHAGRESAPSTSPSSSSPPTKDGCRRPRSTSPSSMPCASRHGVVALTGVDLVDSRSRRARCSRGRRADRGDNPGESWPVVSVSAVTGAWPRRLPRRLAAALDAAGAPRRHRRGRVCGSTGPSSSEAPGWSSPGRWSDGPLHKGDAVALCPGDGEARIRTIQSHETEVEAVGPGNRVGPQPGRDRPRGCAEGHDAGGPPEHSPSTQRLLAELRPVRAWPGAVTDRGAYHLHAGSGSLARRGPSARRHAPRRPDAGAPHARRAGRPADGRSLRRPRGGRRVVVGGGVVLDPRPPERREAARLPRRSVPCSTATEMRGPRRCSSRGGVSHPLALDADTGGGKVGRRRRGQRPRHDDRRSAAATIRTLAELTAAFHAGNPLRPGIPAATLASTAGVEPTGAGGPRRRRTRVGSPRRAPPFASTGFEVVWTTEHQKGVGRRLESQLVDAGLAVPRASSLDLDQRTVPCRRSQTTCSSSSVTTWPTSPSRSIEIMSRLETFDDGFTVSEFRDTMGISRRHAVPLLEWLDGQRLDVAPGRRPHAQTAAEATSWRRSDSVNPPQMP